MSERLVQRCTVLAVFLEYKLEKQAKKILRVLVLSLDLIHSAAHTVNFLRLSILQGEVSRVLINVATTAATFQIKKH